MPTPKQKLASNNKKAVMKPKTQEVQKRSSTNLPRAASVSNQKNLTVSSTNQKKQMASSTPKSSASVVQKRRRLEPTINTSSYVKILATFSEFIKALQKQFHLNDDEVNDELSMLYSSLKDALATEVSAMQNIKICENRIEQLKQLSQDVERAKTIAKQLKEQEIILDVPTPDFEYMDKAIKDSVDFVKRVETQLQDLNKKQTEVEKGFLKNSRDLIAMIKVMLKERNLAMSSEEIEHNLINVFSVLRYKIALGDKEKMGQTLSEVERNMLESANLRALSALLGQKETSEEKFDINKIITNLGSRLGLHKREVIELAAKQFAEGLENEY